jgi:phosphoribosylformylglycinamidine synthase
LDNHDQILFKYCDAAGNINAESNPNGTIYNIAGYAILQECFWDDASSERACDSELANTDGKLIMIRS